MAQILLAGGAGFVNTQAINSTKDYPVGSSSFLLSGGTEADAQQKMESAGNWSNIYIYVPANANTGNSTFKSRIASGAGNQATPTITTGATGAFEDTTNSDVVSVGSLIDLELVTANSGGALTYNAMASLFSAATNTVTRYSTMPVGGSNASTASTTYFCKWFSQTQYITTVETGTQFTSLDAGTLKNPFWNVSTNARTNASTLNSRQNAGNGNLTKSIGTGATGIFEDTSNSDTIAVGDTIDHAVTLGTTTNTLSFHQTGVEFSTTDASSQFIHAGGSGGITQNVSVTDYLTLGGQSATTTEADNNTKVNIASTISNMAINVITNTVTNAGTISFRKNSGAGNQTKSITGSTTGIFQDTVNSDNTIPTDNICTKLATGTSGTSTIYQYVAYSLTTSIYIRLLYRGLFADQNVNRSSTY